MSKAGLSGEAKRDLLGRFAAESNPLVEIGQALGPEALDVVLRCLGGHKDHIPTRENFWLKLTRELRDARICADFTGANHHELAAEHGLKPRHIRRILAESAPKRTTGSAISDKAGRHG